jgi:hypothetical protein
MKGTNDNTRHLFRALLSDAEKERMECVIDKSGLRKERWHREAILEKLERESQKQEAHS